MLSKRSAVETSRGSAQNKLNVSFPRDSSATLGMTENKTLGMTVKEKDLGMTENKKAGMAGRG